MHKHGNLELFRENKDNYARETRAFLGQGLLRVHFYLDKLKIKTKKELESKVASHPKFSIKIVPEQFCA